MNNFGWLDGVSIISGEQALSPLSIGMLEAERKYSTYLGIAYEDDSTNRQRLYAVCIHSLIKCNECCRIIGT